jgi:hypothetical protein
MHCQKILFDIEFQTALQEFTGLAYFYAKPSILQGSESWLSAGRVTMTGLPRIRPMASPMEISMKSCGYCIPQAIRHFARHWNL